MKLKHLVVAWGEVVLVVTAVQAHRMDVVLTPKRADTGALLKNLILCAVDPN